MWYNDSIKNLIEVFEMEYMGYNEALLLEIGEGDIEDCWTGSKVGTYKNAKNVWFDVRPLRRFLHRKYKDVKFLEIDDDYYDIEDSPKEKESTEQEYDYWSMKPIVMVDGAENNSTGDFGWRNNIELIDMFGHKEVHSLSLTFNVERSQPQRLILESKLNTNKPKGKNKKPISVTLKLKKDKNKKLYFECDGKKIENLKVWFGKPGTIVLECYEDGNKSDDLDNLLLDEEECVEFSLQNVTKNIKHLNVSFNKKNSDEFTIYYFVETKDSNGEYEFDSCETISLSKDKIGNEDVMLGYISAHNGKPVETKKIKMFIASGNCKKFDFEGKKSTSNKQMDLLRKKGFTELDVKRGTDKQTDKYCVVYDGRRIDKESIGSFSDTKSWSNNSFNKINDINVNECGINAEKKQLKQDETSTPGNSCESKSKKAFTYTETDGGSEYEKQAIKNYLNNKVDSVIWYANPNVVKNLEYKNLGCGHLREKDCIIVNVSDLCNSYVYRYENNDKDLWFFQRWYAKFVLFFNIGKFAKIFSWKEQYETDSSIKQIKSSFDSSGKNNETNKKNEKETEGGDMAAPPDYNGNDLFDSNF